MLLAHHFELNPNSKNLQNLIQGSNHQLFLANTSCLYQKGRHDAWLEQPKANQTLRTLQISPLLCLIKKDTHHKHAIMKKYNQRCLKKWLLYSPLGCPLIRRLQILKSFHPQRGINQRVKGECLMMDICKGNINSALSPSLPATHTHTHIKGTSYPIFSFRANVSGTHSLVITTATTFQRCYRLLKNSFPRSPL